MSKIKKLIALTLALAMVLSVSAFAGYKVDTYADADKINEDCVDAVELLYALDIMVGDGKNFNPESAVTRAEMAKMIYVILNYGDDDKAVTYTGGKFFDDVEAGYWAEGYINYCASTKLIAGRGDGKFDPTAPVTTAEAAKMLLTAIGYSAEARGYVGANWDKNVLSDAAIIGLLNGYKSNVNTYAPRQWVAVMIENMLLDAWTYFNMAPTFSGLLTSGETGDGVLPMGAKYYSLDSFSSVAYATEDALIDGDDLASEDTVLFANELEIEGTGIKAADLGQKYKVIYNFDTMEAYSVRSLADVDSARFYDMEVEVKHATSSNKPNNKYVFTIGEIEATLAGDGEVKFLTSDNYNGEIDAEELYELIEGDVFSPDTLKAIDSEGDGDIDYFYLTNYFYGYVVETATSNKYGEYINVVAPGTEGDEDDYVYLTFADEDDYNLYLKDTVITDDEIEEENIVKISYDIESGKWVIEVLPQAKGVEYEEYDDKNDIFVLDGKEYYIAEDTDDWSETCEEFLLDEDYLGEELNIVYDGDLIVYVSEDDDSYDSMDKVNEQLVLLIDANDEYSNNTIREKEAIEYMTIDGKTHIAVYDVDEDDAVDFDTVMEAAATDNVADRLYKIKSGTKGRVWLEELDDENINEQLKVKKSVLNGFEEGEGYIVDATGSTVKIETADEETYKVDADNKYFVGSWNSDDEFQATVMTLDELKHCIDEDAYAQILTYENAKGTRTTVVGGYLFLELTSDDASDYLYIEKIGRITADGRKVDVVFSNGDKKSITVDEDASDELVKDVLYTYVYYFMDDEYVLTQVELGEQAAEIIDFDDDNYVWFDEADEHELDDETIAIITIEVDRDQTQVDDQDEEDVPEFELIVKGIEFVALKDLKLEDIENDVDDKTYTQYTDFYLTAQDEDEVYEDLFYVANFQLMDTCQDMEDTLVDMLAEIFEAILAGEKTFEVQE